MHGRQLCVCVCAASFLAANGEDVTCLSEYYLRRKGFRSVPLSPLVYTPIAHRPDWFWKQIFQMRGIDPESEAWPAFLFVGAQEAMTLCSIEGGRYWDCVLDVRKVYELAQGSARSAFAGRLAAVFGIPLAARDQLPGHLRLSICAPALCAESQVVQEIFPLAVDMLMGQRPQQMLGNASFRDVVVAHEVAGWQDFDIDFAIVGADRCGTTSLRKNMELHPDVMIKGDEEETILSYELANRLLPLKAQVEEYNARVQERMTAKFNQTGHRPRIVGIANAHLFQSALVRQRLALMPQLKLVLTVCEPVGRMEKIFMIDKYCHDDLLAAQKRLVAGPHRDGSEVCFSSTSALLTERHGQLKLFWDQRIEMARHLAALAELFPSRLFVLHQTELRDTPSNIFNELAAFVGLRPFPEKIVFRRYNSVGGHRTDLCFNASLVRSLQRLSEREYVMQESILQASRGISIALRSTRCDLVDKVEATYCPNGANIDC